MSWKQRYLPPDASHWQGRTDTPANACFFQIIQYLDLTQPFTSPTQTAFAFLGFRSDEGIRRNFGRIGAATGAFALREAIAKLPIQRDHLLCFDAGDITCDDGDLESAQQALGKAVAHLLSHHITPILLGGGHEIAFGHYQGINAALPDQAVSIVNLDAHFDMRPLLVQQKGSSGTPFLQIANLLKMENKPFQYYCIGIQNTGNTRALFETANAHQVAILLAEDMQSGNQCNQFINTLLTNEKQLYFTICLDAFAAPYAPGVSAPQPLGLTPWQVIPLIRQLAASGKVISYDLAELSPPNDDNQRTAKLAATLIYEIIHHHPLKTAG